MIAYLDCISGISGDMFLSCLVDAGWNVDALRAAVGALSLPAEEYAIESRLVMKGALRATQVSVRTVRTMHQRRLADIDTILGRSQLGPAVRERAMAIFRRLAEAEAAVHGTTVDEVHFHEVGAVDAIIDVVGAAAGLEAMGIERLYCSPMPLGHGWTASAHGPLPLPAPATLKLLASANAPTVPAPGEGELVTPTGAAIAATLASFSRPAMTLSRIATGAGQKDFAWPNVARLWLGEVTPPDHGLIVQLETNIDDMNPQFYQPLMQKLFEAGALDAWLTPVQMKKGRPGVVVAALAPARLEATLAEIILRHSTTLGVRVCNVHRHETQRDTRTVETRFGPVRVKIKRLAEEQLEACPEFEDCRRLAEQHDVPVHVVSDEARRHAQFSA